MIQLYHIIRQIFNGTRAINNTIKYMIICFGIALVHFYFMVTFAVMNVWPLAFYNVAAVAFYLFHGIVTTRKKKFSYIFASSIAEILFHSGMASVMLGLDWGFMAHTIALVPVSFYLSYTLPKYEEGVAPPLILSAIVMVWYYFIQAVCRGNLPLYHGQYPDYMPTVFYYFNTMVAFAMLIVFSTLFSLEIRFMQRRLVQENRNLEEIAKFDPLTSLLNRRSMDSYMHEVVKIVEETQKEFCLIMADIDNFKNINDTYGHACGDEVLMAVAHKVSECVREGDYVCRWGGEEILILVQANLETACQIAERICRNIASIGIDYKGQTVHVTVTMGVAPYQRGGNIHSVIEKADQNLYKGKTSGKNQVVR